MPTPEELRDGDVGFIGIDTRESASVLEAGMLQDGKNIRIEQNQISSRKGLQSLLDTFTFNEIGSVKGSGIYTDANGLEKLVIVVSDGMYLFDINDKTISQKYDFPNGRQVTERCEVLQAVNKLYILRGEATKFIDGATFSANGPGHTLVTVVTTVAHGLTAGDEFSIHTPHAPMNGAFIVTSVLSPTSFTYTLLVGHNASSGTASIDVGPHVLIWTGLTTLLVAPAVEIDGSNADFPMTGTAMYFKNRIYCKVTRDEIAVSDYLTDNDGNWKFDRTIQQMVINEGDGQAIVGFHPWVQDKVLVFKERSIYVASFADNVTTPEIVLQDSFVETLSSDLGAVSKRSIANLGTKVYFLSQKGLYAIEPQLDTKLLANTIPISRPIQKYIDRININYIKNAVAKVYNGRLYLSVALDDSIYNNAVLVYNLLNAAWESIDTYPENFDAENMHLMTYGDKQRLIYADYDGSVFLTEEKQYDAYNYQQDALIGQDLSGYVTIGGETLQGIAIPFEFSDDTDIFNQHVIAGYALSRSFNMKNYQNKRFSYLSVSNSVDEYGLTQIGVKTKNPDSYSIIDFTGFTETEDSVYTSPVRKKAVEIAVEITAITGRFNIQSWIISARDHGSNKRTKS